MTQLMREFNEQARTLELQIEGAAALYLAERDPSARDLVDFELISDEEVTLEDIRDQYQDSRIDDDDLVAMGFCFSLKVNGIDGNEAIQFAYKYGLTVMMHEEGMELPPDDDAWLYEDMSQLDADGADDMEDWYYQVLLTREYVEQQVADLEAGLRQAA